MAYWLHRFGLVALLASLPCSIARAQSTMASHPGKVREACDTPQHHQFDFWVGRWDVYRADKNALVAHSTIEKLYGGCAIRENWMPLVGGAGGSLNAYRANLHQWRQFWTDADGDLDEYSGAFEDGKMIFTGTSSNLSGEVSSVRMVFEAQADGSVTQTGFQLGSDRKTWQLQYKFIYRPGRR